MSTTKTTARRIVKSLGDTSRFAIKPMFGEYALYVDEKVVGLICDDQLYLKIVPASLELEKSCKKGSPYEGTKEQYIIDETHYSEAGVVALKIADAIPTPRKKSKR